MFFLMGFSGLLNEMLGSTRTGDSKSTWKVRSVCVCFIYVVLVKLFCVTNRVSLDVRRVE